MKKYPHNGPMKSLTKMPLYLGLGVFVLSILMTTIKVGERGSITGTQSRASTTSSTLRLRSVTPNLISLEVLAQKEIEGIDVALRYDKSVIRILPSTLTPSDAFVTAGGIVDEQNGTFSFSAVAKKAGIQSGVVATFRVEASGRDKIPSNNSLSFINDGVSTTVIDRGTGQNILSNVEGIPSK